MTDINSMDLNSLLSFGARPYSRLRMYKDDHRIDSRVGLFKKTKNPQKISTSIRESLTKLKNNSEIPALHQMFNPKIYTQNATKLNAKIEKHNKHIEKIPTILKKILSPFIDTRLYEFVPDEVDAEIIEKLHQGFEKKEQYQPSTRYAYAKAFNKLPESIKNSEEIKFVEVPKEKFVDIHHNLDTLKQYFGEIELPQLFIFLTPKGKQYLYYVDKEENVNPGTVKDGKLRFQLRGGITFNNVKEVYKEFPKILESSPVSAGELDDERNWAYWIGNEPKVESAGPESEEVEDESDIESEEVESGEESAALKAITYKPSEKFKNAFNGLSQDIKTNPNIRFIEWGEKLPDNNSVKDKAYLALKINPMLDDEHLKLLFVVLTPSGSSTPVFAFQDDTLKITVGAWQDNQIVFNNQLVSINDSLEEIYNKITI